MPSEVMIEVACGDPMEAFHPAFPSAVIRIDVLHMKRGASNANALGQIDRFVNNTAMLGVALIDGRPIRAQHRSRSGRGPTVASIVRESTVSNALDNVCPSRSRMTQTPTSSSRSRPLREFFLPAAALARRAIQRPRALVRSPRTGDPAAQCGQCDTPSASSSRTTVGAGSGADKAVSSLCFWVALRIGSRVSHSLNSASFIDT